MRGEISHEGIVAYCSFSEISCETARIMQVRPVMLTLHILLSSSYHLGSTLAFGLNNVNQAQQGD